MLRDGVDGDLEGVFAGDVAGDGDYGSVGLGWLETGMEGGEPTCRLFRRSLQRLASSAEDEDFGGAVAVEGEGHGFAEPAAAACNDEDHVFDVEKILQAEVSHVELSLGVERLQM